MKGGYDEAVRHLRAVVSQSAQRFSDVSWDEHVHAALGQFKLEPRTESQRWRVRSDIDIRTCKDLRALTMEGDCLLPWFHDGDVQFFEPGVPALDGDIVLLKVPPHENSDHRYSFATKVLHRYDDRWLLLSNEPPLWFTQKKQRRFQLCGVMVAALHYSAPKPRSSALQAMLARSQENGSAEGYDWTPTYLASVLGDISGATACLQ